MVASPNTNATLPRYSVAGILQRYLPEFQRTDRLPWQKLRILQKLIDCRTPKAGSHAWQCAGCGHFCANYNSCGDRHCLTCSGSKRLAWLEQMQSWTLPCHYWHIVLTVPHEFNDLTAANSRKMYGLLFTAGTKAILRLLHKEFDVTASMASMLHTWGQAMLTHCHSHNVVSCGGLSGDGGRWIDIDPNHPHLQGEALPQAYRRLFLKGLRRLFVKECLMMPAPMANIKTMQDFDNWLSPVAAKQWMVNVQPPPAGCDGPATALGYLSRYLAGACIGDQRILADDGTHVTIRIKDYRHDGALDDITITGVEFIRRFVQHLLPSRLRRVRYAGLWGPRRRVELLDQCRELLKDRIRQMEETENVIDEEASEEEPQEEEIENTPKSCPRCHGRDLIFIEEYWPGGQSTFPRREMSSGNTAAPETQHREAVPP